MEGEKSRRQEAGGRRAEGLAYERAVRTVFFERAAERAWAPVSPTSFPLRLT